jgi:hypothetical protein
VRTAWADSALEGYRLYCHQPMETHTVTDEVRLGMWQVSMCLLHAPYWEADVAESLRGSAATLEQQEPWREGPSLDDTGNQAVDMVDSRWSEEGSMVVADCGLPGD